MKRIFLSLAFATFAVSTSFAQNNLPEESQDFLDEHFSEWQIKQTDVEDGRLSVDSSDMYVVQLSNGMVLDFDKQGNIVEIKGNGERIPEDALPEKVYDYIKENYDTTFIMGWEKDGEEHEVELANGTELEFDKNENFMEEDKSWF